MDVDSDMDDDEEDYEPKSQEEEDGRLHIGRFNSRGQQESIAAYSAPQTKKGSAPIRKDTSKFRKAAPPNLTGGTAVR